MNLPFSETAFLDVVGAYNRALWPVVIVLWAVTAGMAVRWWRQGCSLSIPLRRMPSDREPYR